MEKDKLIIEHVYTVAIPCQQAFDFFIKQFTKWWPKDYTWSGDSLEFIGIEPQVGGRCYERGPHGFECQFGRVILWNPPHEIRLIWQINDKGQPDPNPTHASEISVRFVACDGNTSDVIFQHSAIERHGENAKHYYEALNSDYGWTAILNCYLKFTNHSN